MGSDTAFLLELGDALRPLEDPVAVGRELTRRLGRALDAGRVVFAFLDGDRAAIVAEHANGVAAMAGDRSSGLLQAGPGEPRIIRDVPIEAALGEDLRAELTGWQIGALVTVTIIVGGAPVAALSVHSTAPREWSDTEIMQVRLAADRGWAAIERARQSEALREGEARMRRMLETDAIGVLIFNAGGTLIDANDVFLGMTGYDRDQIAAGQLSWRNMTPAEWMEKSEVQWADVSRTGRIGPYEKQYLRRDGSRTWMLFAGREMGDGTLIEFGLDINDRKQAEDALRLSEERLRVALEAGRLGAWRFDLANGTQEWDRRQYEILGVDPTVPPTRDLFLSLVHPDDRRLVAFTKADLEPTGHYLDSEFRIIRPDGEERWITAHSVVRQNAQGEAVEMIGVNSDVTEQHRAQDALVESEQRLRVALEAGRMGTWRHDLHTGRQRWDARQTELLGLSPDVEPSRDLFLSLVHPEDRDMVAYTPDMLEPGQFHDSEFRVVGPNGEERWITSHSLAVHDANGQAIERIGVNWDVTEQKRAQETLKVMVSELQHRTRNLIAVVQSVAGQTMRSSASLEDFRSRFGERLMALARVQGLLSRADVERITIGAIVEMELAALGAMDRVSLDGPPVPLRNSVVQMLALALHELATNARKYGALSTETGRLTVAWSVGRSETGDRQLVVDWHETNIGKPLDTAKGPGGGFGRVLIERALPQSLGGRTTFSLGEGELRCVIEVPLDRSPSQ